jgi:hypothetical protein
MAQHKIKKNIWPYVDALFIKLRKNIMEKKVLILIADDLLKMQEKIKKILF